MKHKLINRKTREETLCTEIKLNGHKYYVSDELPEKEGEKCYSHYTKEIVFYKLPHTIRCVKIIATTNNSIDIPQVVDEVEELAREFATKPVNPLNPTGTITCLLSQNGFEKGYNKAKEQFGNSDKDVVAYSRWIILKSLKEETSGYTFEQLLQLWKEQQPINVYYE